MPGFRAVKAVFSALFLCSVVSAAKYEKGAAVKVVANKVGPYSNPTETYPYYSLPFCRPDSMKRQSQQLGELLSGDRKVNTPYHVKFREDVHNAELCDRTLSYGDVLAFTRACEEDYFFELYVDGLPVWGYIGEHEHEDLILGHTENSKHYLYTHLVFVLGYNEDQVVTAFVQTDPHKRQDITTPLFEGTPVTFTYSVTWEPSTVSHKHRMDVYQDSQFLPTTLEIHWLSLINSLVLALLLTAFLAVILVRVVKNDFTRYMRADDDEELGGEEETGWKLVHGDVFRVPHFSNALAAFVGAGAHLFCMALVLLSLTVVGAVQTQRRGSLLTSFIVIYSLTAGIGGYVSARLYKQLKGTNWVWNVVLTALVFPGPLLLCFTFLNTTAVVHSSTAALPFGTIIVVLALFLFVATPLTILGGIAGHNSQPSKTPCRTLKVPRQIPPVAWHRSGAASTFWAGFLPFSAISLELHYIFTSVWGHQSYTLYGILFLAFVLLAIVTSFVVIALTYFQLVVEDYRWWWRSLASGGMVGVFIFMYCFYFYYNHTDMTGFLQTSFYFGYMSIVSWAAFLMMGFVGFVSSSKFVHYIYSSIKIE